MARRKLSDEPDRMFVHETKWSEVTETICVKIKNFTEKIDDLDNKKKPIESPKFTLAGNELFVSVHPEDIRENSGEFIRKKIKEEEVESKSRPKMFCYDQFGSVDDGLLGMAYYANSVKFTHQPSQRKFEVKSQVRKFLRRHVQNEGSCHSR